MRLSQADLSEMSEADIRALIMPCGKTVSEAEDTNYCAACPSGLKTRCLRLWAKRCHAWKGDDGGDLQKM
jgi:hypothetical protein